MNTTTQSPAINDTVRLITAYKELLKLDSNHIRIDLQNTLCALRDSIALRLGISSEEAQVTFEQQAICEKYNA